MRTAHQLPEASSKGWPRHCFPKLRRGIPTTWLGHVILQYALQYAGLLNATHHPWPSARLPCSRRSFFLC